MANVSKYSAMLRNVLRLDAVMNVVSGAALLFAAGSLSELLGLNSIMGGSANMTLQIIGVLLLVNGVGLFRNAARESLNLKEAAVSAMMDAAWVIGSAALLFSSLAFTNTGWWLIAVIADIVAVFGIAKYYLLYRIKGEDSVENGLQYNG